MKRNAKWYIRQNLMDNVLAYVDYRRQAGSGPMRDRVNMMGGLLVCVNARMWT